MTEEEEAGGTGGDVVEVHGYVTLDWVNEGSERLQHEGRKRERNKGRSVKTCVCVCVFVSALIDYLQLARNICN